MARKRLKHEWTPALLDEKLPESVYVLSKDEREGMNAALQQLDAGLGISHEIVEAELDHLLDELTPEEEEELDERIRESKAGLGIPHEIVRAEVRQWLTAEQLKDIEIGRKQMAAGEWIFHEDFMRELEEEF